MLAKKIEGRGTLSDFAGTVDGSGAKFDARKLRYDLLPPQWTRGLVDVLTYGAKKYADNNWLKGMSWEALIAAAERHVAAWRLGEDLDAESGLNHLLHAAWDLLAVYYYQGCGGSYNEFDNRRFRERF